jgi:hypothetical protein
MSPVMETDSAPSGGVPIKTSDEPVDSRSNPDSFRQTPIPLQSPRSTGELGGATKSVAIPTPLVPLHHRRQRSRWYNKQSRRRTAKLA